MSAKTGVDGRHDAFQRLGLGDADQPDGGRITACGAGGSGDLFSHESRAFEPDSAEQLTYWSAACRGYTAPGPEAANDWPLGSSFVAPSRGVLMAVDIAQLLAFAVKNNASDLHLSAGVPPMIRVDGDVKRVNMPPLTHKEVHSMVYDIMNDKQRKVFEEFFETDFSFEIPNLARFRVNAFNQNRGAGAVFRNIPSLIKTLDDLNAPKVFKDLCMQPRGLVLVTGPTGSGKSTTLAAMVDYVNDEPARPHHHDRGSDRVRARIQALPDQPARSASRHARLQRGAALGAARRPRRHAGRRNARPRDHPPRADRGRDRPPRVRHAAHEFGGQDHRPYRRRVPGSREGNGARDAVGIAARGDFADAC